MDRREFIKTTSAMAAGTSLFGLPGIANAQAAQAAVDAAKQYAGSEISIVWEAGLQSLDPLNFSGPRWEAETGIKVKVIEVPVAEMFTKILQEHRAGTGAYDALNVIPSWMPDLVRAGALENLDPMVDKYNYRDQLASIAPVYRDNQMTVDGKIYGFPDDGDVFIMEPGVVVGLHGFALAGQIVFYCRKIIGVRAAAGTPHDLDFDGRANESRIENVPV